MKRRPAIHLRVTPEDHKLIRYLAVDWGTTVQGAAEKLMLRALARVKRVREMPR